MTGSTGNCDQSCIEQARKAARGEYAAERERDYMIATCERMADAAVRVVLEHLRDQAEDYPDENNFAPAPSAVPVSVVDSLLKELEDDEGWIDVDCEVER